MGPPDRIIRLDAVLDHPQGIDTDGEMLWVSEVDRKRRKGFVHQFELNTGRKVRTRDVTQGERFHPGGIALDKDFLWVPVAEYKPKSSSTILRLRKSDLSPESQFEVRDHIGAIALWQRRIFGANWDAETIRELPDGPAHPNPTGTRYQDMKVDLGMLVGSGLREKGGAVEWLRLPGFELLRRLDAGMTDRGVALTHEGMAIYGGKIYFLAEDGPARLFVFTLPE